MVTGKTNKPMIGMPRKESVLIGQKKTKKACWLASGLEPIGVDIHSGMANGVRGFIEKQNYWSELKRKARKAYLLAKIFSQSESMVEIFSQSESMVSRISQWLDSPGRKACWLDNKNKESVLIGRRLKRIGVDIHPRIANGVPGFIGKHMYWSNNTGKHTDWLRALYKCSQSEKSNWNNWPISGQKNKKC